MLRTLDRYLLRELAPPVVIGVAVFTFFIVIDRVYQLTDLVIAKGVPFLPVLSLLAFMLPALLILTLPLALLVAVLLTCGRLAGDLEIAAFTAAGVSPWRLFRPFLAAALLVAGLTAILTVFIAPRATTALQDQAVQILETRAAAGLKERTFIDTFGQVVVYADEIDPAPMALRRVVVSDERDAAVSRVVVAREGRVLTDPETRRVALRLVDGAITETDARDPGRFRHTAFTVYDMALPLDPSFLSTRWTDKPERSLSLPGLVRQARDGGASGPYAVELHKRFALPVAAIVFVLVGFPLGIQAPRGGRAAALGLSLAVTLTYYLLFTTLESLALRGRLPAGPAIWLPNLLFGAAGLALLRSSARPSPGRWASLGWRLWAETAGRARRAARGTARLEPPPGPRDSTFIIDRYLLREYAKLLAGGLAVGAVLYIVVELLQTLDRYLRVKPPLADVAQYFLYRLPGVLHQGLPVIVLVATVFLFLSLTRQRELDALKAAGVSLYRTSLPILAAATVISAGSVVVQETVLPDLNARAHEVERVNIRGHAPRHLQRQSRIWYRSSGTRFLRMELLDPVDRSLDGLLVLDLDADFRLVRRLEARRARWTPGGWEATSGVARAFGPGGEVSSVPFDRARLELKEGIADLIQVQRPPDTMSFSELRAYVARLRESGRQVGKYVVELYAKLSFPLVHVIFALVAIPLAIGSSRSGGRALGIGIAVVIAVAYWVVHSLAISFAKADLLPPALAAWTANVVFGGLGAALFLRART